MNNLDFNQLLGRNQEVEKMKNFLIQFEQSQSQQQTQPNIAKKGIYIYGKSGIGKTRFAINLLKSLNYDVIIYNASDIKNKNIIDIINQHNTSNKSILSILNGTHKKIAIVIDEIDAINSNDKTSLTSLIKIIRPKKTKKQKEEETTRNPIICIGDDYSDKKIKDLKKICENIQLQPPTNTQIANILQLSLQQQQHEENKENLVENSLKENMIAFIQNDLRKLAIIWNLYTTNKETCSVKNSILTLKLNEELVSHKIKHLLNQVEPFDTHCTYINETDRTIMSLLWHENIIEVLQKHPNNISIPIYLRILDNICFVDYIERITFQKQITLFNELTSLIKTFGSNFIYHMTPNIRKYKFNPTEVRFTKVLTKYSTEYNNSVFIHYLCNQLNMDMKDLFSFFKHLIYLEQNAPISYNTIIDNIANMTEITQLDIQRMYRYLTKYQCQGDIKTQNIDIESEEDN